MKSKILAISFVVLIAFDGFLTFWATNNGYVETNTLMFPFTRYSLFPIYKIITALVAVAIVSYLVRRFPKLNWVANIGYGISIVFYTWIIALNLIAI